MGITFGTSVLGMSTHLTLGVQQRASIRSFARSAGTLTKRGEETLNALDTFDRNQALDQELKKQNEAATKKTQRESNVLESFKSASLAGSSRHAASMAGAYESQALAYAQQAKEAAAMGDEEKAAELSHKALMASANANKMHAEEAKLARKEAEERSAKIRQERKEEIAERKAEEKAREALAAAKQRRLEEAQDKAVDAIHHLEEARKAKHERKAAEAEVWGKRLEEGQFWIRQMQLVQEGKHPTQAVARAQIQAFRDASVAVETVAPDFTPTVLAA